MPEAKSDSKTLGDGPPDKDDKDEGPSEASGNVSTCSIYE